MSIPVSHLPIHLPVSDEGVLIPRALLEKLGLTDERTVEIRHDKKYVLSVIAYDPIRDMGKNPVTIEDVDDASVNHDKYIYG